MKANYSHTRRDRKNTYQIGDRKNKQIFISLRTLRISIASKTNWESGDWRQRCWWVETGEWNIINRFLNLIFIYLRGCLGQLARTTTNPMAHWTSCKPNEHVRHRGGDRRAQWGSNPGAEEGNKPLPPLGQDLKCFLIWFLNLLSAGDLGKREREGWSVG
jgi:hypothetical protein